MTIVKATEIANAPVSPSRRLGQRERKVLAVADSCVPAVAGNWVTAPTTVTGAIDQLASQVRAMECIVATYDKATMLGTVAAQDLGVTIPDNFVVVSIVAHVITAITDGAGGAPTIQLLAATDDISSLSPVVLEANTAGTCRIGGAQGALVTSEPGTTTEIAPVITTGARALNATIGSDAATAGKIRWFIWGFRSI